MSTHVLFMFCSCIVTSPFSAVSVSSSEISRRSGSKVAPHSATAKLHLGAPKLLKLKGRVQHALVEPHQGLKANGHGRNKAAIHYGPLGSNGLSDGVQIIRGQYVF